MSKARDALVYIVIAPYLPCEQRVRIGPWELIPVADFHDGDAVDEHVATLARGLSDLYERPLNSGTSGVFARLEGGRVGDEPESFESLQRLRRSLVVAVIAGNQSPLEEPDPNKGHRSVTSDNAMVAAPGITRKGGWTSILTGGRVRWIEGGLCVLPDPEFPSPTIPPPAELRIPILGRLDDWELGDATWKAIARDTDAARRLARAVDWLDFANRNSSSLVPDVRIPALRAGFEVLLDSSTTSDLRDALSALLDRPNAPSMNRHWRDPASGKIKRAHMTDLGWWFQRFSLLRNDLMHGRLSPDHAWYFDRRSHLDLAEWWLLQAIRVTVANEVDPALLEDPWDRPYTRANQRRSG